MTDKNLIEEINSINPTPENTDLKSTMKAWLWGPKEAEKQSKLL